jgi:hypothetical protein
MSARFRLVVLGALVVLGTGNLPAQSPGLQQAMRQKLANAQGLLEAVVKADFPAVTRYADPLSRISDAEIASWQASGDPDYVQQATLFLLSVRGLREAAAEENIDAVSLEYSTLIASCIRCHTYVRNLRNVSLAPAGPPLAARIPPR